MPYIVCVNQPGCLPESKPTAHASVEQARAAVRDEVIGYTPTEDREAASTAVWAQLLSLGELGGVVGPLPDGYVIDVTSCSYGELWKLATGSKANQPVNTEDIIDAYNEGE